MLALLSLDDRPCNFHFPAEIAAIGGDEVLLPPRELLGHFNTPGNALELRDWLQNLPEVSRLIVSIDMLAYGGLVASRRTNTSLDLALERLETIRKWRQSRPDVPIYAFNVLMRLAITMDSDASVPHYYNVMRFARLVDEAARFPSEEKERELAEVKAAIPSEILDQYCGARARNHAVNLKMTEWLADGTFDFLLITQEDCTQFGLHRREQDEITSRVKELGVDERFALHPGADEAALTLLARSWNGSTKFGIHWNDQNAKRQIAVFEDVPYEDALHSHIAAMGGEVVDEAADVELFVNAPIGISQKEEAPDAAAHRTLQLESFVDEIERALNEDKHVAVCDVAFPNGADNVLLELLRARETILPRLSAFGGWNTAGNTTGTVLAQCAAFGRGGNVELNRQFVFERLLDDWFYQAKLRGELEAVARERGFSPLNMNGQSKGIEKLARVEMEEFARDLATQFGARVENLHVALPWGRTFEIEVGAKLV